MGRNSFCIPGLILIIAAHAASGCATPLDDAAASGDSEGRSSAHAAPSPTDMAAIERALANPPSVDQLIASGQLKTGSSDLLAVDKIRNGPAIDYDDQVGNGVVWIYDLIGHCSAQVINKWFLLTAAHCVQPEWMFYIVRFTNSAGDAVSVYEGPAYAFLQPAWQLGDMDTALLYLPGGMPTCHHSLSQCAASQPGIPQNAMIQYHRAGYPVAARPAYTMAGYGGIDDGGSGSGVLRKGQAQLAWADFTRQNIGFMLQVNWLDNMQPRPCVGDSGSPLVNTLADRLMHTGIASVLWNESCLPSQGAAFYSGLSQWQAEWTWILMGAVRGQFQLPFYCAAFGTESGEALFFCDNDGTVL